MVRGWLNRLGRLARLTQDMRRFLRTPVSAEQAVEIVYPIMKISLDNNFTKLKMTPWITTAHRSS